MACPLVQCAQTVGKYIFRVHVVLHFKTVRPRKTTLLSLFSIARTVRGCQETGGYSYDIIYKSIPLVLVITLFATIKKAMPFLSWRRGFTSPRTLSYCRRRGSGTVPCAVAKC